MAVATIAEAAGQPTTRAAATGAHRLPVLALVQSALSGSLAVLLWAKSQRPRR